MMETIRRFGLQYCDLETMLWNVSVMLRALTLNIDERNRKPIPIIFYILTVGIALGYFYVYLVSMSWFVFYRCPATGDLLAAIIVFSLGSSSEIGTVKFVFMFWHIDKVRRIVSECLACDSSVVPGSRFSNNLLRTLKQVKKRAMVFWVVIIGNGVVYVIKPIMLPGRHFTEDMFILYVEYLLKKWTNVRDYYMREKKRAKKFEVNKRRYMKKYYFSHSLAFLDSFKSKDRSTSHSDTQEMDTEVYLEDTSTDMVSYEQCVVDEDSVSQRIFFKTEEEDPMSSKSSGTPVLIPSEKAAASLSANKNFLLSLIPDVTSLNERQNMKFRLGVLNLLNDLKFGLEPMDKNPNYQIATLLMTAGVIFTCYLPANITAFLIVVAGYLEAQMLSLTEELLHLWEDAEEHYYKTEHTSVLDNSNEQLDVKKRVINEYVEKHLKEIIRTHGRNINLLHQVEDVFSGAIALEFFLLVVGLIAELLGGLENTYIEIPFALMQVGMDCLTGQRVMDASAKFERAVYDCKWENYNLSNMKIVLTMLQSSQKTMKLTAGGIIMLSSSCFMQVIRSIYSAYTTLRSTMK